MEKIDSGAPLANGGMAPGPQLCIEHEQAGDTCAFMLIVKLAPRVSGRAAGVHVSRVNCLDVPSG